jgi:hypothetical protein
VVCNASSFPTCKLREDSFDERAGKTNTSIVVYMSPSLCRIFLSRDTPPKRLVVNVEERAHVGRGVGGAGGSAAPKDHDNADDEQAHERAAEAGGKLPDKA